MNIKYLPGAFMAVGLLVASPAFAQTPPAQRQPTQEGAPAHPEPCTLAENANPAADPDCPQYKQRTQNLSPSPLQAGAGQKN